MVFGCRVADRVGCISVIGRLLVDAASEQRRERWSFLTNHAIVLLLVAEQRDIRIVEIAERTGVGNRAVHFILRDLVEGGYVQRRRVGRRNIYAVSADSPLRVFPRAHVRDLLALAAVDHAAAAPV